MISVPLPPPGRDRSSFRSAARVVAMACCLAVAACDDAPPEPQPLPGDVLVTLVSPNGAEGAVLLTTAETGIVDISADSPIQLFHKNEAGVDRIVALRDEAGEIRFRMTVEDVNRPPQLNVVEVADAANRLRANLTGYDIDVEPLAGGQP